MNLLHKIKPTVYSRSYCAARRHSRLKPKADSEPAAAPAPWHVENSELRAPVKVDVKAALLRMPPQVYLADLKPLETTDGLAFDPLSKKVMQTDVRDPKEKAATIAKLKQAKLKPQAFSLSGRMGGVPKEVRKCLRWTDGSGGRPDIAAQGLGDRCPETGVSIFHLEGALGHQGLHRR